MKGSKILLLRTPAQEKVLLNTSSNENKKFLVEKGINEMLEKRAVKKVCQHKDQHSQSQFLSNLFLVMKKDLGYRAVLNLIAVLNRAFKPVSLDLMES